MENFIEFNEEYTEFKILSIPFGHQDLMDIVYYILNHQDYKGEKDRLLVAEKCGPKFKAAVQLGNFNYQVGNGGVHQWVNNSYAVEDLTDINKIISKYAEKLKLEEITFPEDNDFEDLKTCKNILDLLSELFKHADPTRSSWLKDCQYCDGSGENQDNDDEEEEEEIGSCIYTRSVNRDNRRNLCVYCNGTGTEKTKKYEEALEFFNFKYAESMFVTPDNKLNDYYQWDKLFQRILDNFEILQIKN